MPQFNKKQSHNSFKNSNCVLVSLNDACFETQSSDAFLIAQLKYLFIVLNGLVLKLLANWKKNISTQQLSDVTLLDKDFIMLSCFKCLLNTVTFLKLCTENNLSFSSVNFRDFLLVNLQQKSFYVLIKLSSSSQYNTWGVWN